MVRTYGMTRRFTVPAMSICAIGVLASAHTGAYGAQYVVQHGGGGTHTSIQSAIDDAVDGDDILVMEGVYFERIQFHGAAVVVHSLDPLDPDIVDSTVIDGALGGHVVTFDSGETPDCVLEGFTIRGGSAEHGGGVFCVNGSSPTIRRNWITENFCVLHGAGVHCSDGASPTIVYNEIFDNFAEGRGAGIYCVSSSAAITDNALYGNAAPGSSGGAIHLGAGTDGVVVADNTMTGNQAVFGGGINIEFSSPLVTRNYISANLGLPRGGGVSIVDGAPLLINNIFAGNLARVGGAVDCNHASPTIRNNTFVGNWGVESSQILLVNGSAGVVTGNVIAFSPGGVAIKALAGSSAIVDYNCFFDNIDGEFAGTIEPGEHNLFVDPGIVQPGEWVADDPDGGDQPIVDVEATLVGAEGANGEARYKLESDRERFRLRVFSLPPFGTHDIHVAGVVIGQISTDGSGDGELEYDTDDGFFPPNFPEANVGDIVNIGGLLQGTFVPNGFGGTIPLFSWTPGNEHLLPGSPCVDAFADAPVGPNEVDYDRQVRRAASVVDIGADEFLATGTGDFDGDSDVDLADAAWFQRCLPAANLGAVACAPGDFDANDVIELLDFAVFSAALTGPAD